MATDIAASCGRPIYAASSGTVEYAGWNGTYGIFVRINHGNGLTTRYAHMSAFRAQMGQRVAAGDVIGWPSLASAAYDQGRSAAGNIIDNGSWRFVDDVPTGIYTIPEISSIGKNEQELTQAKVPYEVGKAFFKSMARAQIAGEPQGMLKILFHRETLEVLGVHCFGYQASEIVHIGQAVMNQPGELNNLKYFVNTTFNYPTMAEAYRVAAYDGLNRLF